MQNAVWKVTELEVLDKNDNKNVVVSAAYKVSATKNNKTFQYSSSVQIQFNDGNFTEFEDLSESQILNWIWQSLGDEKDKILSRMEKELDKQPVTPILVIKPVSLTLPWVKVSL
jgi:hypothetical protein